MNRPKALFATVFCAVLAGFGLRAAVAGNSVPSPWPPQVGKPYPDLEMTDQGGRKIKLSDYRGHVLLIEPIGMNCGACLGWSGTDKYGPYRGLSGQAGLHPFEDEFQRMTGLSLRDSRVIQIQLLLFNTELKPTIPADAATWAAHFHRELSHNQIVLAGSAALLEPARYQATYNLVPGFQLVDKDFILRCDSTSDSPKTSLWNEFVPLAKKLLQEAP